MCTTSWKPSPPTAPSSVWRSHGSSQYSSEGQQGRGVLPCPSPTALLAWPLWPWWHQNAGLWGFVAESRRGRRLVGASRPPVTVKGCWSEFIHEEGRGGTCIRTHWAYIQAPLKEASWCWQRVLIAKDLGLWSGAKLQSHIIPASVQSLCKVIWYHSCTNTLEEWISFSLAIGVVKFRNV